MYRQAQTRAPLWSRTAGTHFTERRQASFSSCKLIRLDEQVGGSACISHPLVVLIVVANAGKINVENPDNARMAITQNVMWYLVAAAVTVFGVSMAVGVVVLEEDGFVCEISSESDGSNSKTGERASESVEAGEWASVAPGLAARIMLEKAKAEGGERWGTYYLAHGSFLGWPEAAANFWGSKPVILGRGAMESSDNDVMQCRVSKLSDVRFEGSRRVRLLPCDAGSSQ